MPKITTKTLPSKPLCRSFQLDREAVNEDDRTVELSFSSEAPYERWFGMEILDHSPGSIRFGRLNSGGAVMVDHHGDQVGVVERAEIGADRKGRAVLRFGRGQRADEVFQDVRDGIRRNVSVGYIIHKMLLESEADGVETYRITDWEPYEISIVSVPADQSVGVGRSDEPTNHEIIIENRSATMTAETTETTTTQPRIDVVAERNAAAEAERKRINEILSMARKHGMQDAANDAISNGTSIDGFRALILDTLGGRAAAPVVQQPAELGMSKAEVKAYSFRRAILGQINDSGVDASYEKEVSREYAKKIGKETRGLLVPPDVLLDGMERTFNQTTGAGSNLIATDLRPDMFIDILRNKSVTAQAGAFMMPGLVGNVAIPRQTGAMTAYWFNAESAGITGASNPTVDQVSLSPNTVGAYGDISRSLLKQSTPAAEAMVRNDIAAVLALAIDLAALKGTGANGQPTGITLTSGINSGNWDTASTPTWSELVAMETAVDVANALDGNFVYVMGANMRGSCKTTVKATGQGGFLMDANGQINGYNVINSNQMSAGEVIFGRFADLIIGMWGGLDLQVNPYIETLEKAGAIRVTALQDVDVAVRQPKAFTFYDNASAS